MYWWTLTPLVSCFLTWLEIDNTISITTNIQQRRRFIWICFSVFIAVNGVLSVILYFMIADNASISALRPPVRAFLIGLGYPALVRLKFTTLKIEDREVSIGLDLIYENIKQSLDKRIRRIVQDAEFEEVKNFIKDKTLEDLLRRSKFLVGQLQLGAEKSKEYLAWCDSTANDQNALEMERKLFLADFILFNRIR